MDHLKILLFSVVGIIGMFPTQMFAQEALFSEDFDAEDSLQMHLIEMIDGDIFRAHVISTKGDSLSFTTRRNIIIKVPYNEVKSVVVINEGGRKKKRKQKRKVKVKLWAEESKIETVKEGEEIEKQKLLYPQSMFIHSTAFRAIPKGTRLYQNIDLYLNSWDYGLGNELSVGVQVLFPVALNLRLRYNHSFSEKIHVGGSANFINYYDLNTLFQGTSINGDIILYPYGVFTYGTPKLYLNATAGVLFPTSKHPVGLEERRGMFTLGFGGQENKFIYKGILSLYKGRKHYYDPVTNTGRIDVDWTLTPGFSLGWVGRKVQVDLGVLVFVNEEFPLPYLSLKKRWR